MKFPKKLRTNIISIVLAGITILFGLLLIYMVGNSTKEGLVCTQVSASPPIFTGDCSSPQTTAATTTPPVVATTPPVATTNVPINTVSVKQVTTKKR